MYKKVDIISYARRNNMTIDQAIKKHEELERIQDCMESPKMRLIEILNLLEECGFEEEYNKLDEIIASLEELQNT